eukprot:g3126.t1
MCNDITFKSVVWTFNLLTVLNHGIFAALFIWRTMISPEPADDILRALDVESKTMCTFLGCQHEEVKEISMSVATKFFQFLGLGNGGKFMYWYMTLEGCFHLGICFGGLLLLLPCRRSRFAEKLYATSLLLEILIMDIPYTLGFTGGSYFCTLNFDRCFGDLPNITSGSWKAGGEYAAFIYTITWMQNLSCVVDWFTYPCEKAYANEHRFIEMAKRQKRR